MAAAQSPPSSSLKITCGMGARFGAVALGRPIVCEDRSWRHESWPRRTSPYSLVAFAAAGGRHRGRGARSTPLSAVGAMSAGLDGGPPRLPVDRASSRRPRLGPAAARLRVRRAAARSCGQFALRPAPRCRGRERHACTSGVDIAAPAGAPVHVATDGVIMRSGVSANLRPLRRGRATRTASAPSTPTWAATRASSARRLRPARPTRSPMSGCSAAARPARTCILNCATRPASR